MVLPPLEVLGERQALTSPKFPEPVLDTPRTVSVIPEALIDQQNAVTLRDVLRNSPGITFQAGEGGAPPGDSLFIRGFSARNDLFVDGARDSGQYARDPFNIEQVEVLKGPSSSAFGRGSTGGAINQATKTPHTDASTEVNAGVGTDAYRRATVDVNQPLSKDFGSAVRLNAMWMEAEQPGRDEVESERWGVAPSLAFGLGKRSSIKFNALHLEQDNLPDYGLPAAAYTDTEIDWSNYYGLTNRDYEEIVHDSVGADLSHHFDDGLTLRNLTRYSTTKRDAAVTAPRLSQTDPTMARRNDLKIQDREHEVLSNLTSLSVELRTGAIRHEVSTGAEFSLENYKNFGAAAAGDDATETSLYNPTPNDPWNGRIARTGALTEADAKTTAFYAYDNIHLSPRWQLNAGVRWEQFDADVENTDEDGQQTTLGRVDEFVSWTGALLFKPSSNSTVYASYGTSFNPSAEELALSESTRRGPSANHPDLGPEESESYELGAKVELLNQRLSLSTALFQTIKTNARTRGADDEPYVLSGEQKVRGIELGVAGLLTSKWSIYGGYAYMDSKVSRSLDEAEQGHELAYTPEHTFSLWTSFQLTQRLLLGAGVQYTDDYYFSTSADAEDVPEDTAYWLINAMAQYAINENLSLQLNVENIADEEYVERGYAAHFTPGAGRRFILTANFDF